MHFQYQYFISIEPKDLFLLPFCFMVVLSRTFVVVIGTVVKIVVFKRKICHRAVDDDKVFNIKSF